MWGRIGGRLRDENEQKRAGVLGELKAWRRPVGSGGLRELLLEKGDQVAGAGTGEGDGNHDGHM
jgi:hypothetical protein